MPFEPLDIPSLPASTEHDSAEAGERRTVGRKAVFLRASIYPVEMFCDAHIRDVSANGVSGEADLELVIGQTLHIAVDDLTYHTGIVKWTRERQFGLYLPNAVGIFGGDLSDVDHGSEVGHQPRSHRAIVNANVRLVTGRPPRPAIVRNLSQWGMLLDTSPGVRIGQQLVIKVGNRPTICGRAQWSRASLIGFKAQVPIDAVAPEPGS